MDNWWWAGSLGDLDYDNTNIVVNGGTLAYIGSTANGSNNRLFTIGASGATLVSGSAGQKWTVTTSTTYPSLRSNGGPLVLTGAGNGEIDAIIPGSGGLTMAGNGTWTLGGANTFTGATTASGGTLLLANSAALSMSSFNAGGAGTLSFGALTSAVFGGLTGTGGTLTLSNAAGTDLPLSVGNNNATTTFGGVLIDTSGGGR